MLIINFEGREVKGLSKGRYDETFAGEDDDIPTQMKNIEYTYAKNSRINKIFEGTIR